MNQQAIKKVLNSGSGKALKDYLLTKLYELRNIENIKEYSTVAKQALEVKSQRRAFIKLREILKDIMDISEDSKEKDPRDSYEVE